MNQPRVCVILLNYKGKEDTIECLQSIKKLAYNNFQTVIVDNSDDISDFNYLKKYLGGGYDDNFTTKFPELTSTDFSKTHYKDFTEKELETDLSDYSNNNLILVKAEQNKGFAAGNNIGVSYAQKRNFEYVWLLNNDTVIEADSLTELVMYSEQNSIGICGSTLRFYNFPDLIQAYGGNVNKFFGTTKHIVNDKYIKSKLDYIVGASFMISGKTIDKIGLLPEEYFLYYEETDYCFKARENGVKLGVATSSKVYHKEGSSTGSDKEPREKSEFSDVLSLKNRIKFHKKYLGGGIGLWVGMIVTFINRIRRGQAIRIIKVLTSDK